MGLGKIKSVIILFQNFGVRPFMSSSAAQMEPTTTVISEYAKSDRSSCKKCSDIISVNTLQLGLVAKDPKGFTVTQWHHSHCLLLGPKNFISSPESIVGFSNLKRSDKDEIKRLMDDNLLGDSKVEKVEDFEEMRSKKMKLHVEKKTIIDFSVFKYDKYKGATLPPNWNAFETVIFLEKGHGLHDSRKIAAFDFDGCLARTSVGKIGAEAWSLMYNSIPNKLKCLYDEGYKLVIFTNESNIDRWKNQRQRAVDSKIGRLNNFITLVNLPIQVFIACGVGKSRNQEKDSFRKPEPGMWHIMEQHLNSGIQIDMDASFYVGDAAGRPNDHSDADIKFAEAVGLNFFLPEDYFG